MSKTGTEDSATESPQIVLTYSTTIAPDAAQTLAVLRQAAAEILDRKRRLGHYAIMWRDGQVVQVEPQDLPALP